MAFKFIRVLITLFIFINITNSFALEKEGSEIAKADKEIVKITSSGLDPSTLTLKSLDGSVFFVNTTPDSLITVDVDFKQRKVHCASSNMKVSEDGHIRSTEPVSPRDFALMCFPDKGSYDVKVYGVSPKNIPLEGKIIVE